MMRVPANLLVTLLAEDSTGGWTFRVSPPVYTQSEVISRSKRSACLFEVSCWLSYAAHIIRSSTCLIPSKGISFSFGKLLIIQWSLYSS